MNKLGNVEEKYDYIYVDGQKFTIYELDTFESIKSRIACGDFQLKLGNNFIKMPSQLPKLIILQENLSSTKNTVLNIKNTQCHTSFFETKSGNQLSKRNFELLDFFRSTILGIDNIYKQSIKIPEKKRKEYIIEELSDLIVKLMNLFSIKDIYDFLSYFQVVITKNYNLSFITNYPFNIIFTEVISKKYNLTFPLDDKFENIKNELEKNQAKVLEDITFFQKFPKYFTEQIQSSEITYTKTSLLVKFKLDIDIYELFNTLEMSTEIPFAYIKNFYKILKTFKPSETWLPKYPHNDDILILYVLNKYNEPYKNKIKTNPKNYSFIIIIAVGTDENNNTLYEMHIESKIDDELKEENLMKRIFSSFPENHNIFDCNYEQLSVEGEYLIPFGENYKFLYIPLFHDLVLNNPFVSQILLIDESVITFRERGGIFSYFRFNKNVVKKNFMSFNLNVYKTELKHQIKYADLLRITDKNQKTKFPKHMTVKFYSAKNKSEAEKFQSILNKILYYYFTHINQILEDYKLLIPNIEKDMQEDEQKLSGYQKIKEKL